jgi:hypothetical protein
LFALGVMDDDEEEETARRTGHRREPTGVARNRVTREAAPPRGPA